MSSPLPRECSSGLHSVKPEASAAAGSSELLTMDVSRSASGQARSHRHGTVPRQAVGACVCPVVRSASLAAVGPRSPAATLRLGGTTG
jgi:hypothetical protein